MCPVCGPAHPKIPLKAGKSKEIPTQLSVELAGLTLPPSPPAWEQGSCSLPVCCFWQLCFACPGQPLPSQDTAATTGCVHLAGAVLNPPGAGTFPLEIPASLNTNHGWLSLCTSTE